MILGNFTTANVKINQPKFGISIELAPGDEVDISQTTYSRIEQFIKDFKLDIVDEDDRKLAQLGTPSGSERMRIYHSGDAKIGNEISPHAPLHVVSGTIEDNPIFDPVEDVTEIEDIISSHEEDPLPDEGSLFSDIVNRSETAPCTEEPTYSSKNLSDMYKKDIVSVAEDLKIDSSGNKGDLINRILKHQGNG